MQTSPVSRVFVWSRWLRLSHWSLTISVSGLLISGWIISYNPMSLAAQDYHFIFAAGMIPALLLRLYLLIFSQGTDNLRDCEIDRHRFVQALQVIRFYLTLGRAPLPRWFGHNPFWGPVYLVIFFFLFLSCLSGLLLTQQIGFIANVSMHELHKISYYIVGAFVILHLPAVFSHDLSNKCSDVSGMINGYRDFPVAKEESQHQFHEVSVNLDELLKSKK
jgi:Ni/Fe-hydrogenase 1 B-type cytochrome subunit